MTPKPSSHVESRQVTSSHVKSRQVTSSHVKHAKPRRVPLRHVASIKRRSPLKVCVQTIPPYSHDTRTCSTYSARVHIRTSHSEPLGLCMLMRLFYFLSYPYTIIHLASCLQPDPFPPDGTIRLPTFTILLSIALCASHR